MARGKPLIRQWNLLKALQAHRFGVSSDELAEWIGCSKRQILRDLKVLQEVGFPIRYEQRDFGKRFWMLSPHFVENKEMILSVTELLGLFMSRQLLIPLGGTQFGDGLTSVIGKITALLPEKVLDYFSSFDETLVVKNIASQDYSRHDKKIRIINQAIYERAVLNIRYKSIGKKRDYDTQYHPYGMIFFDTNLYCIGYMAEYGEIRTLKISRIISVELSGKSFERPATFSLRTYFQNSFGIFTSGTLQKIKIKLTSWAATTVREQKWHLSQKILKDCENHVIVQYELPDTTEFKRWVLGFGQHAVVMQPRSLASEIDEELRAASGHYRHKKPKK